MKKKFGIKGGEHIDPDKLAEKAQLTVKKVKDSLILTYVEQCLANQDE